MVAVFLVLFSHTSVCDHKTRRSGPSGSGPVTSVTVGASRNCFSLDEQFLLAGVLVVPLGVESTNTGYLGTRVGSLVRCVYPLRSTFLLRDVVSNFSCLQASQERLDFPGMVDRSPCSRVAEGLEPES